MMVRADVLTRFKPGHPCSNTGRTWIRKGTVPHNKQGIEIICGKCGNVFISNKSSNIKNREIWKEHFYGKNNQNISV